MVTTQSEPVYRGNPYDADCPTRRILDRIGDRWTVLVVGVLGEGDARFSQLRRRIEDVSQKMLTQTLRPLHEYRRSWSYDARPGLPLRTSSRSVADRRG